MAEFYRERDSPDRAISIYRALMEENHLSTLHRLEITKALGDTFVEAGRPQDALESYKGLRKVLEETEEGRRFASDPSLTGPIYEGLADAQVRTGLHEAATASYERALHLCNMDGAKCSAYNRVILLNNIASCHLVLGREDAVARALEVAQIALDLIEKGELDDGDVLARVKRNLVELLRSAPKSQRP